MKSFFKGFAAAILGSALFMGSIIGWAKLTDQNSANAASTDSTADAVYDALIADRLASLDLTGTGTTDSSSAGTATGFSGSDSSSGAVTTSPAASGASGSSAGSAGGASQTPTAASAGNSASSASASGTGASSSATGTTVKPPANGNFDGAVTADKAPAEYASYMQKIENELKTTYASNLRVEYLNKQIIISVWENGLIDRLTKGQKNGTTNTIWNSMKVALSDISSTYSNGLSAASLEGSRIHAHLLNEKDLDKIILAYTDGKLVHDGLDHE